MGKSKQSSSGGGGDDAKHEQKLQAVLLADSFTKTFRPVSLDKAKVLCPLNNVALLDYAMEFLAGAGVEELFVVCLRDEVEEHVEQNTWTNTTMDVTCVKDSSLTNAGDALRELDKRNLVKSDPFILMFGDAVTNVDVAPVLAAHKDRHKKDSSAIMTLLFKKVGGWSCEDGKAIYSSLRAANEDLIVALDPNQDNRILVYDDRRNQKSTSIPCSFFDSHAQADFCCDLLDCGIDICSPDVLARFSDEFDYRDIRREFVTNLVAEEEEGLQSKIFAHILGPSEYAARVHDFATYAAVSQDLLRRWCYPVVPDNLPSGYEKEYRYAPERHFQYREMKKGRTKIGRGSALRGPGMVGSHCQIGDKCLIERSVIGSHCKLSSRVALKDSFLWDNVVMEEGATAIQSILADGCVIKAGAKVQRGCVIGQGCVIGNNVTVPEFTRITMSLEKDDFDDDAFDDFDDEDDEDEDDEGTESGKETDKVFVSDHNVVGPDGQGCVWKPMVDDEDEDEDDGLSPLELMKEQSIGFDVLAMLQKRQEVQREDELLDDNDGDEGGDFIDQGGQGLADYGDSPLTFGTDMISTNMTEDGGIITGRQRGIDVVKELKIICMEHEETAPAENLAIELNSFKFSQNATYSDCTMAATLAILERMQLAPGVSAGKLVASLKHRLEHWGPLLKKMSIGTDEEKAIVVAIEKTATAGGPLGEALSKAPAFRVVLQTMHDQEILSEEAILSWAADRREEDKESEVGKLFNQEPTQEFLEWLEDEDDDEDDSDDDDDEEDSDDD